MGYFDYLVYIGGGGGGGWSNFDFKNFDFISKTLTSFQNSDFISKT